jgi:thiamine-monophosphate kinase
VTEFELIENLCRGLPTNASTRVGPGDDCAVLDLGVPGQHILFKTDAVVEGVHFLADADPRRIGHKALARCLSDVAAMAGTPTHALVTLGLRSGKEAERAKSIYDGLTALARRHGVAVVGGETTTSPERLFVSVAVLGWVDPEKCVLRIGAKAGDALFVTGELGGAVESGRHLEFEPRLVEARWLAANFELRAMLDLSDGLAGDLRHLLRGDGLGAELLLDAIPLSRAARQESARSGKLATTLALTGGEDYELLFAVAAGRAVTMLDAWKIRFPDLRLTCVGKVTREPGVRLRNRDGVLPLNDDGYVHFNES